MRKKQTGGVKMKLISRVCTVFACMLLVFALLPITAAAEADIIEEDYYGDGIKWEIAYEETGTFEEDITLIISGSGAMPDLPGPNDVPWFQFVEDNGFNINRIVINEGITAVGSYSFTNLRYLTAVSMPVGLVSIGTWAFGNCESLGSVIIPSGCLSIGGGAFENCTGLRSVIISDSCSSIGDLAFAGCTSLRSVNFGGNAPSIGARSFQGVSAAAWCSCLKDGWNEDTMLQYGAENLTWSRHAYNEGETVKEASCTEDGIIKYTCDLCGQSYDTAVPASGHTVVIDPAVEPDYQTEGLTEGSHCSVCGDIIVAQETVPKLGYTIDLSAIPEGRAVEINGVFCDRNEPPVIREKAVLFATAYAYGESKGADLVKQYPSSMKVYRLSCDEANRTYTSEEIGALDDLLKYSGFSIRITGVPGIRMITSVRESLKKYLIDTGIEGYKLTEYGTLVQWENELNGAALTFETCGDRYAAAYKQGVSDPVFGRDGEYLMYTNVFVGFTDAQCAQELVMRPYMKLNNGEDEMVLYGGTLQRSIGFIALQNKDKFVPGSTAYEYIWRLIRAAYGDTYDGGYIKG